MENTALIPVQQLNAECVCLNVQRAARRVARRFDAAFRPLGITSGQFTILGALNQPQPVTLGELANILGMERTTLTRNLVPLETAGLLRSSAVDGDARARALALTDAGRARLAAATPLWHGLQAELTAPMHDNGWSVAREALATLEPD
ncbi:MAG: MarR family transcriptional regulator [Sphingomonas sp.]|nr:MarR family transcriptional regulator [Sphingomonas sp.]